MRKRKLLNLLGRTVLWGAAVAIFYSYEGEFTWQSFLILAAVYSLGSLGYLFPFNPKE
jgi:hypothetical protein